MRQLSRREGIMIALIVLFAVFFLVNALDWYRTALAHGDDRLMVNTAESEARINSGAGVGCPVDGCSGGTGAFRCVHWNGSRYVGFYEHVTHKIIGTRPEGYNESAEMKTAVRTYYGKPGTMVIKVVTGGGTLSISWEAGKQT